MKHRDRYNRSPFKKKNSVMKQQQEESSQDFLTLNSNFKVSKLDNSLSGSPSLTSLNPSQSGRNSRILQQIADESTMKSYHENRARRRDNLTKALKIKLNKVAPDSQVQKKVVTSEDVEKIYKNLMDKMEDFDIKSEESVNSDQEILPTPIANHQP